MEEKKLSKNTSQDEKISRGEFFGIAKKKTREAALSWVEKLFAPLTNISEGLTELKENESWLELFRAEEVTPIPKMVIRQGKCYFLLKDNENKIKVIYGMCIKDGFAMNYLENEDGLYCASCQTLYYLNRDGKYEEGKKYALEVPSRVENDQVCIFL